jgi:hypothetical protein
MSSTLATTKPSRAIIATVRIAVLLLVTTPQYIITTPRTAEITIAFIIQFYTFAYGNLTNIFE